MRMAPVRRPTLGAVYEQAKDKVTGSPGSRKAESTDPSQACNPIIPPKQRQNVRRPTHRHNTIADKTLFSIGKAQHRSRLRINGLEPKAMPELTGHPSPQVSRMHSCCCLQWNDLPGAMKAVAAGRRRRAAAVFILSAGEDVANEAQQTRNE